MAISTEKKEKLTKLLQGFTDAEDIHDLDNTRIGNLIEKFNKDQETSREQLAALVSIIEQQKKTISTFSKLITSALEQMGKAFTDKVEELRGTVGKGDPNAPALFKNMINAISNVDRSVKESNTTLKAWRWPQYSAVSVRNKNFANVNPATDGLGIGDYDYVSLSYTGSNLTGAIFKQGGASGTTVATLALTYSGSNLTSVTKT